MNLKLLIILFFLICSQEQLLGQPTKMHTILPFWTFDITEGFRDSTLESKFYTAYIVDSMIENSLVIQNYDPDEQVKISMSYDESNWKDYYIKPGSTTIYNTYERNGFLNQKFYLRVYTEKENNPNYYKEYLTEAERCIIIGWDRYSKIWNAWYVECTFPNSSN